MHACICYRLCAIVADRRKEIYVIVDSLLDFLLQFVVSLSYRCHRNHNMTDNRFLLAFLLITLSTICALSLHTSSIIPHFPIRFPFTQHLAWVTEILCTMITHFRGVLKKSLPGLWQVGYINNFCPPLHPACLQASSFLLLLLAVSFFFDSGQIYESHTRRER